MGKRSIGDVIKGARKKKGLSAVEVAALCNVTRSRVYQWEEADRILDKNIAALAKALGLSERLLRRVNGRRRLKPPAELGQDDGPESDDEDGLEPVHGGPFWM